MALFWMHAALWCLLCALEVHARMMTPESTLDVQGQFFLECFAGEGVLTLGVLLTKVPCMRPWDSRYGQQFDVLQHGVL